ncbi:MAG: LacI family DNA-binding transcriptional regulator [Terrimicrobiaceae bacterium]
MVLKNSEKQIKSLKKIRISQQQIARDLGVSQTLVSMVLNGRKKGVSEESYERIWEHARRSGYRPKGIAPELISTRPVTKSVGFILRAGAKLYSQSPFFGHVQHGLHESLAEQGISLAFLGTENDLDVEAIKRMRDPDAFLGLVILGEVSRPFLQAMLKLDPRVVTVSAQYPGLCNSVTSNEEQAADQMVQHLMELGHTRFAYVGGNKGSQRARYRLRAIESALHIRKASIDPEFCIEADTGDRLAGSHVSESLLKVAGRNAPPTAWICFNGIMARGTVSHLIRKGFDVPGKISVTAFDRTRVSEEEPPTLTAADTSPELMGRVAAEILLRNAEGPGQRFMDTVLSADLTCRESSGPVLRRKN